MASFKVTLAYDGTDYVGWQRQAAGVSIQGLLEDALRGLDGRDVRVTGAGRTDAGVHALGQVASFTLERTFSPDTLLRALNAHLPDAIRVLAVSEAPPTFHPRFGARAKTYRYRIWNGDVISPFERRYAWHLAGRLDVGAMRAAASLIAGRHNFASFRATGASTQTTEREVFVSRIAEHTQSELPNPEFLTIVYEISGSGFLRHMVRIIVGSLVEVGRGRRPVAWIEDLLALPDRTAAGPTAPAVGLFLVGVEYAGALAALS
jgi:tRNA pseudouridine38-40 synthase